MEISSQYERMSFWKNVDAELEYLGKNRKSLATEAGFCLSNVGKGIKTGSSPSADTAVKIARVLGVSVEYLVDGSDSEETKAARSHISGELNLFRKYRAVVKELSALSPESQCAVTTLIKNLKGK